ncbi:hypothetical protein MKX03_019454, partial [Papaver bracteatum]
MIMSEKNRREISKYLFQEGVLYAKKDFNLAKHPDIDVPNLQVIKLTRNYEGGDRDGYRGGPRGGAPGEFGGDKGGGAPAEYQPQFK